jgi:hypothetical protein
LEKNDMKAEVSLQRQLIDVANLAHQ